MPNTFSPILRVSLIQANLHWESAEKNIEMFTRKIQDIEEDTNLIVLPEMFSTGFTMNAAANAEAMDGVTVQWMRKMAFQKQAVIVGSIIVEEDKKYYNRLIWMRPDGSFNHYDKRHLFRLAGEENTYTQGKHQWIMVWKGWKIYPLICYDLRFPVWSRRKKDFDYDLLLYVANWPERRVQAWKTLLPARAIENQSYVVGLNRVGEDGNAMTHSGDSMVIDFKGNVMSNFEPGKEKTETISLDIQPLIDFRQQFAFAEDADDFEIKP
jgi:omega-amidase